MLDAGYSMPDARCAIDLHHSACPSTIASTLTPNCHLMPGKILNFEFLPSSLHPISYKNICIPCTSIIPVAAKNKLLSIGAEHREGIKTFVS